MSLRLLSTLALAAALAQPAQAEPARYNEKVDVNGYTYRVVMRGPEVKVISKTISANFRGRSVERKNEMLQAAAQVTGCKMINPYWVDNNLVGEISCGGDS